MRGRSKEQTWWIREVSARESKIRKKEGRTLKERKMTVDIIVAFSKACLVFICD
jgi:hypothetical protein